MKHIIYRFLSVLFVLTLSLHFAYAERISQEDAAVVASNFMNAGVAQSGIHKAPAKRMTLKQSAATTEQPQYYIYESAEGGWVMVAANDAAHPILAYSKTGHFETEDQPRNIQKWLAGYEKQLQYAEQNNVAATEEVAKEWNKLRKSAPLTPEGNVVVAPLIKTTWGQSAPYNNLCPQQGSTRTITGCVATAMAQVMNYWQWPETGTGSYSYTSQTNNLSCSADFEATTYDWANMVDHYTSYKSGTTTISVSTPTTAQKNAVATLMLHCGVAAEMDYGLTFSGAFAIYSNASFTDKRCAAYALLNNFKYKKSTLKCYYRPGGYGYSAVNDATWLNLLKTELDAKRPVMYGGADSEGGHSFICDGYDDQDFFHFNFGWSGSCDGYYEVDDIVPGTGGEGAVNGSYNEGQEIIIGITPDKPDITITWSVQGTETSKTYAYGALWSPTTEPSDCSGGKKFVGWTEQSSIASGAKPSDLFASGTKMVTEAKTYYAVYATASSGSSPESWDLCEDVASVTEGTYVITWNNSLYLPSETAANSNPAVGSGITESSKSLTNTVSSAMQWTFTGDNTDGFTISHTSGSTTYYLNSSNTAQGISVSTSNSTTWKVSLDATYGMLLKGSDSGNRYLAVYNSATWRYYNTGNSYTGTMRLYKQTGGSGTSYSDYSLTCPTPCTNEITITKGENPANGSFTIDNSGTVCIDEGNATVVVTATPSEHYHLATVTSASGTAGAISGNTCTITGINASTTINVTFAADSKEVVNWYVAGTPTAEEKYPGETLAGITAPDEDDCDGSKVFMGWTATSDYSSDDAPADLFTDPTTKTMPAGGANYYAVFAEQEGGGGGNVVEYDGTGLVTLDEIGATYSGISTYASSYAPYIIKFDNTNDYIQFVLDAPPASLSFDYRMIGGASTSKMVIKECATANGSYTEVETLTISGSSNSTGTLTTSASFTQKCIRMVFTKGSNVGVGAITIAGAGGYSGYTTSCTPPEHVTVTFNANEGSGTMAPQVMDYNTATALSKNTFVREGYTFQGWAKTSDGAKLYNDEETVTLKKDITLYAVWSPNGYAIITGDLENGSIETNPANTAEYGATVTITVTPNSGYNFGSITVTNNTTGLPVSTSGTGNVQTFTMPASAVTVTATVSGIPTYTVTWSMDGDNSHTEEYIEGATINFPSTATGCYGKAFIGWSAVEVEETDTKPALVTSATMGTSPLIYYAVYAIEEGSGGAASWVETAITSLTTSDVFVIVGNDLYALPNNATGTPPTSSVTVSGGQITSTVGDELKWNISGNGSSGYTFYPNGNTAKWLCSNTTASTKSNDNIRIGTSNRKVWVLSGDQLVTNDTYTDRYLAAYSGSDWRGYTSASTSATTIKFYKQDGGGSSYSAYTTSCGASISAKNIGWITAAKGQKVKRTIPVSASGFDEETTLTAVTSNPHFNAALAETVVPAGNAGLSTTLTIEYLPTEAETIEDNVSVTLSAGGLNKTITVSGRSLPDEFLIITKKGDTWYALPANMNEGPNEYNGVAVVPNDATTPTGIDVSPSTLIYRLASVAEDRYTESGHRALLVGFNNLCLWSNMATTTGKENIQNSTDVASAKTKNLEWLLTTTDGVRYTIANPDHPHYEAGRRLAYGSKFGMYNTETEFYLIPAGCTTQPQDVFANPRRVDVTISWVSNASQMTIDIWKNAEMTGAPVTSVTATSSPKVVTDLEETTDYWFKLTPAGGESCAVTGSFTTTGPTIDVVEWQDDAVVIFVDKDEDLHPKIVIDGEVEHGIGSGAAATDIFFSKYFEAESSAKMLAIFNGTNAAISLADVSILQRQNGGSSSYTPLSLATFGKTPGYIQSGEEIILYNEDQTANKDKIMKCAEEDDTFDSWTKVNNKNLEFSGKGTIRLFRGGKCIDIIGAMPTGGSEGDIDDITKSPLEGPTQPSWGDDKGFVATGDDYTTTDVEESDYELSTNRCLLIRKAFVTSGDSAVWNNYGDFKTLGSYTGIDGKQHKSEWAGLRILTGYDSNHKKTYEYTCAGFQEVGHFDYSSYYKEWTTVKEPTELDACDKNPDEKTYTMHIDDLAQFSCLNVRFQLTDPDDVTHVLTETPVQVPIIVKGGEHTTVDEIFHSIMKKDNGDPAYEQSIERCQTCDVVILSDAVLTKATDGTLHDAPQIGNLKIYQGGKLIVPSGTTYKVNSLSFRSEDDVVAKANIQGQLNITGGDNQVFLDLREDPTNWHFITLPYDCNVSDIRFANGDPTPPVLGSDFLLMKYDGELRAATRNDRSWVNVAADETLKKGLGYIYSLPGGGKVKRELRFPMSNDVISNDVELDDKTVGSVFGYGCDKTDEELRPNHKGWNLVGEPFLMPYSSAFGSLASLRTGKLIHEPIDPWNGKWVIEDNPSTQNLRYIVVPIDNGWERYEQVPIAGYELQPFTCYFVQIGGTDPTEAQGIEFKKEQVVRSPMIRRSRAEYEEVEDTHPVWCAVELISPNGEKDETTLLISDDFTDNYDMMSDLVKMRGSYYTYYQHPVLASRNNEGEMAFNALPDESAAAGVPLNFFAATGGEFTIAYNDKYGREDVKAVMLHDKELGQWHDLMAEPYTFPTTRTDNTERFVLSVRVDRKKTPQSITEIEDGTQTNGPRKILINEHVYILRDGKVYDVTGKQMSNL